MSNKLFNGSDESDAEDLTLGTNKEYAKSYNKFRQKELLKKCKFTKQTAFQILDIYIFYTYS